MKKTLLVLTLAACLSVPSADAQMGQEMALFNSPAYEAAAAPLRNAPPRQYNFSKAVLSDVMRLMAEDAGIGFFGLPEGPNSGENLVTFTLNASPFMALETLAKANGVSLIHSNGIWYLRPANDQELIGRIYEINYNAQELVTKNSQGGGAGGSGGGSGDSGGSSGSSGGLNLQGSPDFFVTEPSRILEGIQNMLDIPTTGGNAAFAPTTSVDSISQLSLGGFQGQPDIAGRSSAAGATPEGGGSQSKVIWNSDSNTLYVVASRQQHQWIESYLASADRPQPMISVEVKFLETSRDPSSDLGIDWDGALGQNGLQVNLTDASGPIDLSNIGGYSLPTAVLSYSDLNLKLRAIFSDRKTKTVSYPRMVTLDNREVSFRSVVNQPVLGSSASSSLGAGATETSSVEYLPIGTVINILPKRMAGNKILLNVSVTVSDIIGTEMINGNPYPIATSRVYTAPLTVQSGYTVAISGLDAARMSETENGLPILARLPLVGYAFKNRKNDRSRQHLMMLITPVAVGTGTEGLTEKPITQEPWLKAPAATAYPDPKAPVYEASYSGQTLRAEPVNDLSDFDSPMSSRKSNHLFGKNEPDIDAGIAAPLEAHMVSRDLGSRVAAPVISDGIPSVPALRDEPAPVEAATSAVAMAPIPSSLNTPMIVTQNSSEVAPAAASLPTADPAQVSAPAADLAEKKSLPAEKIADPTDGKATPAEKKSEPAVAPAAVIDPKVAAIVSGLGKLKVDLAAIPAGEEKLSADDGKMVATVFAEAQKLLDQVEEVRGDKKAPLQGELGDAWWDLINVKTQAMKLSRRSPESLAVTVDAEAKP